MKIASVTRLITFGVVLVILAVSVVSLWPQPKRVTATAYFPRAVSVYPGSDVRILGIKVGEIESVTPAGRAVRVKFWWEAEHKVPADAKAVIASPSIVADRYIQLTPVYSKGDVMADGAEIPLARTAVPLELDQIYQSLNDLSVALGPKGANDQGALSRLLDVSAANLNGQGAKLNQTITDVSTLTQTLSGNSKSLFSTIRQLQTFVSALAANDQLVKQFNTNFAATSTTLAGERKDLAAALNLLATALGEVATFVKDNRALVRTTVSSATQLSQILVKEKAAIAEVLETAPLGLGNLARVYNPQYGTLDQRVNMAQLDDPADFICSLLLQANQPLSTCSALKPVFEALPKLPLLSSLTGSGGPAGTPWAPAPKPKLPSPDPVDPTLGGLVPGEVSR
ncbi:phospholipid/cholesterol/gamma-HCH transport system substrate-binding protein [Kribbella sp. VKM Ac-2527]|uniref:Phospholipid/cholesterol/gamma-HCH transport system substrate-binding protein n=1 Tax=Kribbella caucasensis TaxID=2512215 RepID=A0A4R6KJ23_9ACTN|nr:MCE family protein [Kribbella sp. VKM Ac-2527]TDO49345.1 phospholipid/cholesterol/gamma-HCH transport system substrate-binding protein [Kribbella sp. VKM Ac-2527]